MSIAVKNDDVKDRQRLCPVNVIKVQRLFHISYVSSPSASRSPLVDIGLSYRMLQ